MVVSRSDGSSDVLGGVVPGICAVLFDGARRDNGILAWRRNNCGLRPQTQLLVGLCGVCKSRVGAELCHKHVSGNAVIRCQLGFAGNKQCRAQVFQGGDAGCVFGRFRRGNAKTYRGNHSRRQGARL